MRLISIYKTPMHHSILYDLLKERSTEEDKFVNISHRKLPDWEDHVEFVDSRPYRFWYFIKEQETVVGYISMNDKNEIGIVLFRKCRGLGLGKKALALFCRTHKPLPAEPSVRNGNFVANINPKNEASIRLFEGFGFKHIQNTYVLE